MAAVAFDTLKLARALRTEAQMSAEQAEGVSHALAEAMSGAELATKPDIAALKMDLTALRSDLEAKMAETKADILKSMLGMIVGALTINVLAILAGMIGLAKLLGH